MSDFLSTGRVDSLWPEWLELYSSLQRGLEKPLAAPFCSTASPTFAVFKNRFMLVGRATKGTFCTEEFLEAVSDSPELALIERKALNRGLVNHHRKSSGFWRAFVKGSRLCGGSKAYENAVWTNLAKISWAEKDIDDRLFSRQSELCERTLVAEFSDYKPTIVHFAVGKLGGACILSVTGSKETDWERFDGNLCDI